jgi:hypothetical protein
MAHALDEEIHRVGVVQATGEAAALVEHRPDDADHDRTPVNSTCTELVLTSSCRLISLARSYAALGDSKALSLFASPLRVR